MVRIDQVFIHCGAVHSEIAARFRTAFPGAEFPSVTNETRLRDIPTDARAVYIGPRSASFVSRFHPPDRIVCASFWKFTSETFCPMGCHYCYLNLTFRIIPYVRIASNLERGLAQMERLLQREAARGRRVMFNIGELADGRILDPVTQLSHHLLPVLDRHPNGMLHVLTKAGSDTIGNYLDLAPLAPGQVIHAASVNPQTVIDLTEVDTPPVADRLAALQELQRGSYRIRLRIDPIFDLRDFGYDEQTALQVYGQLADEIGAYCQPELVTLGSYRPDPRLLPYLHRRYPDSPVLNVPTYQEGRKRRIAGRVLLYRNLVARLRAVFPKVHIALCKETPEMWRKVGLEVRPLQCSCLPFAGERRLLPLSQGHIHSETASPASIHPSGSHIPGCPPAPANWPG